MEKTYFSRGLVALGFFAGFAGSLSSGCEKSCDCKARKMGSGDFVIQDQVEYRKAEEYPIEQPREVFDDLVGAELSIGDTTDDSALVYLSYEKKGEEIRLTFERQLYSFDPAPGGAGGESSGGAGGSD